MRKVKNIIVRVHRRTIKPVRDLMNQAYLEKPRFFNRYSTDCSYSRGNLVHLTDIPKKLGRSNRHQFRQADTLALCGYSLILERRHPRLKATGQASSTSVLLEEPSCGRVVQARGRGPDQ